MTQEELQNIIQYSEVSTVQFKERIDDNYSTGFPKVYNAMRKNGSPDPIFETDENNQYFLATLPIHPAFLNEEIKEKSPECTEKSPECTEKSTEKSPGCTEKSREKVIKFLSQHPDASQADLIKEAGITRRAVEKLISRLKQEGLLERQGSDRKGKWIVKYRF